MTIASLTYPLIGAGNLFEWRERPLANIFQHTVFTAFGLGNGWLTLIPVLAVYAAAIWLGARATGTLKFRADAKLALIALTLWVLLAGVLSRLLGERHSYAGLPDVANHNGLPKSSVIAAAGVALGGLLLALWAERRSSKRPQLEDQQRPTPLAAES